MTFFCWSATLGLGAKMTGALGWVWPQSQCFTPVAALETLFPTPLLYSQPSVCFTSIGRLDKLFSLLYQVPNPSTFLYIMSLEVNVNVLLTVE